MECEVKKWMVLFLKGGRIIGLSARLVFNRGVAILNTEILKFYPWDRSLPQGAHPWMHSNEFPDPKSLKSRKSWSNTRYFGVYRWSCFLWSSFQAWGRGLYLVSWVGDTPFLLWHTARQTAQRLWAITLGTVARPAKMNPADLALIDTQESLAVAGQRLRLQSILCAEIIELQYLWTEIKKIVGFFVIQC